MKRALLRAATVLAAVLTTVGVAATGATASPVAQRFSVSSGDNCTYGYTEGQLQWRSAVPTTAVAVTGIVRDRPDVSEPVACRDDNRYTVARYSAYDRDRLVDETIRRVNNGVAKFEFVLGANSPVAGIDHVVIQVCRVSLLAPSPTPDYCGRPHTFVPPVIGPATSF